MTGMTRRSSSSTEAGCALGPGGFPADVDDVGPLFGQEQCPFHRSLRRNPLSAVGETVRRDVENPHQPGELAQLPRLAGKCPGAKGRLRYPIIVYAPAARRKAASSCAGSRSMSRTTPPASTNQYKGTLLTP